MTVDDALDAADRFNQSDYDPVMRTLADEVRRLRELLPDERERERLQAIVGGLGAVTAVGHAEWEDVKCARDYLRRLLAASHSEGTP